LPGWLSFDAATLSFSGTPGNGDVGSVDLKVIATDLAGDHTSSAFTLTVANTNDAPVLAELLPDATATEDQPFQYTIPAYAFTDEDAGDVLTYRATLADGSPLPGWLTLNA